MSDNQAIREALQFFGIDYADPCDCDILENGAVYFGLTEILPIGSLYPREE